MIIIITGASHTGKTVLAQRMLEKYHYPTLSIDHLKMGLIRSHYTNISVEDDDNLTQYLWPILREMIKTAIENNQNMIIEGCYIPFDWEKDFSEGYLSHIQFTCICMSESYINHHFEDIMQNSSIIENRLDESYFTKEICLKEYSYYLKSCIDHELDYILIDDKYDVFEQLR